MNGTENIKIKKFKMQKEKCHKIHSQSLRKLNLEKEFAVKPRINIVFLCWICLNILWNIH